MENKISFNAKNRKAKLFFADKAYFLLKKMILSRKISQNDVLSESKIATILGMSRTPVREALKRLKTEGIIISYDKKGYFFNIPTIKGIRDIYEIRILLEGSAAKYAAQKIDFNGLEYFEKRFMEFKKGLSQKRHGKNNEGYNFNQVDKEYNFVSMGRDFHLYIIENTGNEKLKELIRSIYDQLEISRILFSYEKRREEAIDEHLEIIRALKERNGEKSQAAMEEHIRNSFNMITNI